MSLDRQCIHSLGTNGALLEDPGEDAADVEYGDDNCEKVGERGLLHKILALPSEYREFERIVRPYIDPFRNVVDGTDLRLLNDEDNDTMLETGERALGEETLVGEERIDDGEDTEELVLL